MSNITSNNQAVKKNPFYYIGPNSTVDLVIFNDENEVLMIKRRDAEGVTERGKWACPGGFLNGKKSVDNTCIPTETIEEAALRETKEETNMDVVINDIVFVNIFEGGGRDPRDNEISWSKSHAFYCLVKKEDYELSHSNQASEIPVTMINNHTTEPNKKGKQNLKGTDDAEDVKWVKLNSLDEENIAFDHKEIIKQAQKKLKKGLTF